MLGVDEAPLSCNFCQIEYAHRRRENVYFESSVTELRTAATRGCALCEFVLQQLLQFNDKLTGHLHILRWTHDGSILNFRLIDNPTKYPYGATGDPLVQIRLSPLSDYTEHRFNTTDNPWTQSTKESWLIARQWLQQCKSKHKKCSEPPSDTRLPTRLIDIGDGEHPRLVLAASLDSNTEYATLSHCWGSYDLLLLQQSNLETFLERVPIDKLPPLHTEVFEAATKLGLRYLWIDTLCIIQDSVDDWAAESVLMDQVYANAVVNIAAANAKDGSGSLYGQREPPFEDFTRPFRVCVDGVVSDYVATSYNMAPDNLDYSLLGDRAWVLQELVLSKRTIYFCREQIFWRCRHFQACELYPQGIPGSSQSELDFQAVHDNGLLEAWTGVVERYTRGQLTFPNKDKLVALSGLAKRAHIPSEYYAGLWASQFPYNLLWFTRARHTLDAPSWSWASVNDRAGYSVTLKRDRVCPLCEVFESHVEPETQDRTGNVRRGALKLRGYLLKTRLLPIEGDVDVGSPWRFAATPNLEITFLKLDGNAPNQTDEFYFFTVCIQAWNWKDHTNVVKSISGLILERTVNAGEYRRIGMFKASHDLRENARNRLSFALYTQIDFRLEPAEVEFLQECERFTDIHDPDDVLETCSWSEVMVRLVKHGRFYKRRRFRNAKVCVVRIV